MKSGLLLWMAIASIPAYAWGGRSLPSGESDPAVVEKVFSSPRGEVQFVLMNGSGGHSAMLRNNKGAIALFKEVEGPAACDFWLISDKSEAVPRGCDFVFHDEAMGELYSVRSEEMEETTLFEAVRGTMRGAIVAL
jgi:hypothetical protein